MERSPRNTHEQVYIDMSIIVIDVKKKYCIGKHMDCEVIPSIRSTWWCYPTSMVFYIFGVYSVWMYLSYFIVEGFIIFSG